MAARDGAIKPRRTRWAGLTLVGIALSLVLGFGLGYVIASSGSAISVHTGSPLSEPEAISLEADGWTYAIPMDVVWLDDGRTVHLRGRPDCLPPEGATEPVKIGVVDASLEGTTWKQVVWVSCRP
jgi:hypothetical protein